MGCNIFYPNKSLPANIPVRVTRRIVQIPIPKPRTRTVVQVTTNMSQHTPQVPIMRIYLCDFLLVPTKNHLKSFLKKPPANSPGRVTRRKDQIPKPKPRKRTVAQGTTNRSHSGSRGLGVVVPKVSSSARHSIGEVAKWVISVESLVLNIV